MKGTTRIEIDRESFTPTSPVPQWGAPRLIWYVAMLFLGEQVHRGRRLTQKLKAETLALLRHINADYLGGFVYDNLIVDQLGNAFRACQDGKNNLYRVQAASDEVNFVVLL